MICRQKQMITPAAALVDKQLVDVTVSRWYLTRGDNDAASWMSPIDVVLAISASAHLLAGIRCRKTQSPSPLDQRQFGEPDASYSVAHEREPVAAAH